MYDWYRKYPPYEGEEPYIYLAFAEADRGKVWEILRPLLERGCRVWYNQGRADSPEEVVRRQARYRGAALTLLYLTDEACGDHNTKSNVLVNQNDDAPILCLDPDGKDRRLAMGLKENIPHIPLYNLRGEEQLVDAIIHAEGFSQELLGEPVKISDESGGKSIFGKLTLLFCILAIVMTILFFLGARNAAPSETEAIEQVTFSDPVLYSAVKEEVGKGPITEETIFGITAITLSGMPENWEDLSLLPSLQKIRIPQKALLGEEPLPEGEYTIELVGGGT